MMEGWLGRIVGVHLFLLQKQTSDSVHSKFRVSYMLGWHSMCFLVLGPMYRLGIFNFVR